MAQEFRCTVAVNYQKLQNTTQSYQTTDTKIFETMRSSMEEFVNSRKWTNLELETHEKLDCSINLLLTERTSATDFKGQLTVQLRRPVYNSTYTSGLLNHIEKDNFSFTYDENRGLEFDINTFFDNLSSILAFYCYQMLGMYFDSFGPNGGDPFYQTASQVAQIAGSTGYKLNWTSKSREHARYWFAENHTNSSYELIHSVYYYYYRLGLDMMTRDQKVARQNIMQALRYVKQLHQTKANLMVVTQFIDVNMSEIVQIFEPATSEEKKEIHEIIKTVRPININKVRNWDKS